MAERNGSLLPKNQALHSLHAALDPKSLILSQFSDSNKPQCLQLSTESFIMERGPRYKEYSDLRDKKLRRKSFAEQQIPEKGGVEKLHGRRSILTPPRMQVKFSSNFNTPPKGPKGFSIMSRSTPDFVSALRKENRKPVAALPPATPPAGPSKNWRISGKVGGGSKSANSAEKRRSCGLMGRKSYTSMEELKGLAAAAGIRIRGEKQGRKIW